jgi:UDP-N-acetylmuramoyl-tripeptide--D-alanyl-D-alanine ligase
MPIRLNKLELKVILGGLTTDNSSPISSCGIEFNSKDVKPGNIFFAIQGSKTHGHDFLENAFENGAALAVVESSAFLQKSSMADKIIVVPDSFKAMQDLARYHRAQFQGKVIGIAGSVGKTTTKDLIGNIGSQIFKCSWSKKSFNNLLGLSYTICNADLADTIWALELGMNHEGELAELSKLALPDVAVITKIAPEHMEFFRDLSHVADAEFEILAGLKDGGILIINGDDSLAQEAFIRNINRWHQRTIILKRFGPTNSDISISDFSHQTTSSIKASFKIQSSDESIAISTDIIGRHNAGNLAGAILAIKSAKPEISLSQIAKTIPSIPPSPMRLNQYITKDGQLIIDDSYNSSPDAVLAALEILRELKISGRSIGLVLGDMYELGDFGEKFHLALHEPIKTLQPNFVVTFGNLMKHLSNSLKATSNETFHAETIEEIGKYLENKKADVILFKASRGVGLDRAVKHILSQQ